MMDIAGDLSVLTLKPSGFCNIGVYDPVFGLILLQIKKEGNMPKVHEIEVLFHNLWGTDINDVTLKFSSSKTDSLEDSYTKASIPAGEKWGPLRRRYVTEPGSGEFDYWSIEFTSTGKLTGKFKGRNEFGCVINTDAPPDGKIDIWISGKERAFYTGYPDSVGHPGVSGYSGIPKDAPDGDYTCSSKVIPIDLHSAGC
jgi:hypothetical protein